MLGYSLLAPIPVMHLRGAIEILQTKEFALFGSEAFDVLNDTASGTKVLIYASHDEAEPIVSYVGTFSGIVGDPMEMRKLEKAGYRPGTTEGEKWSFYWKIKEIEPLSTPIPLSEIQLASGRYLNGYPRGPLHVLN